MEKVILLGMGGHSHSVIDSIENEGKYQIVGAVEVEPYLDMQYKNYSVIGSDKNLFEIFESGVQNAFICIGFLQDGNLRNRLYKKLKKIGYNLPNIIDPTAVLASNVLLGEGNYIGKKVVINANSQIRNMCIINTGAIIEHDCFVDDFSHISVGAILCGNVSVGYESFVGSNATIIQGQVVGKNATVGAGAVVISNVEESCTVIGNPATKMYKNEGEGLLCL